MEERRRNKDKDSKKEPAQQSSKSTTSKSRAFAEKEVGGIRWDTSTTEGSVFDGIRLNRRFGPPDRSNSTTYSGGDGNGKEKEAKQSQQQHHHFSQF